MILKSVDKKDSQIAELERLASIAPADRKIKIEQELRAVRAGLKAEQESAYLIDFHLRDSKNTLVIHDLRLDVGRRVAQIDHLLLHRTLTVFVLETKSFHAGVKITDEGEFLRWNDYKKAFEGMASPVAQNERHVVVLKDAFKQIDMPTRLGMRLSPTFEPYVLVSPNARVDRPKKHETSRVLKADMLIDAIDKRFEKEGVLETVTAMAKLVSADTLLDIGRQLVHLHQPIKFDYAAKFGLSGMAETASVIDEPAPAAYVADKGQTTEKARCRSCSSEKLSIQHGKYGYYFKCADCDGNTPIKIGCGKDGHKERIRKEGPRFFRECEQCNSSMLYFVNSN
jgi:hypothetical protein